MLSQPLPMGQSLESLAAPAPGLYVHVPFCRSKCRYCGFFSVAQPEQQGRFIAALRQEVKSRGPDWPGFDTCYVGGGSPSVLHDEALTELMRVVRQGFDLEADAEVTLEVNPADVTASRARRWRSLGFNRVSLGVQSFRPAELLWLGRRHDAEQASLAVLALRAAGFGHLGLDLVQGLPGQSLEQRLQSLNLALSFKPEHLSCYELTVEHGTPLAAEVAAGRFSLPDADAAADAYLATVELLERRGYLQYEVSNFAKTEAHTSRHNAKYWKHVPYLGLGPSAHSFDGRHRWHNVCSVGDYCRALATGGTAALHRERLTERQLRWERVSLGLRTRGGIDSADVDDTPATRTALEQLAEQGLLLPSGDLLIPTVSGLLVADALARCLLFDDVTCP